MKNQFNSGQHQVVLDVLFFNLIGLHLLVLVDYALVGCFDVILVTPVKHFIIQLHSSRLGVTLLAANLVINDFDVQLGHHFI